MELQSFDVSILKYSDTLVYSLTHSILSRILFLGIHCYNSYEHVYRYVHVWKVSLPWSIKTIWYGSFRYLPILLAQQDFFPGGLLREGGVEGGIWYQSLILVPSGNRTQNGKDSKQALMVEV